MSCSDHNQDLLLLTHGELTGVRRALTELHVRRCPRCQEQAHAYDALSSAIAGALRPEHMRPWRPPSAAGAAPSGMRWGVVAATALALSVVVPAAAVWVPEQRWCPGFAHPAAGAKCLESGPPQRMPTPANAPAQKPALHAPDVRKSETPTRRCRRRAIAAQPPGQEEGTGSA